MNTIYIIFVDKSITKQIKNSLSFKRLKLEFFNNNKHIGLYSNNVTIKRQH